MYESPHVRTHRTGKSAERLLSKAINEGLFQEAKIHEGGCGSIEPYSTLFESLCVGKAVLCLGYRPLSFVICAQMNWLNMQVFVHNGITCYSGWAKGLINSSLLNFI
jgi:hypothetical protein